MDWSSNREEGEARSCLGETGLEGGNFILDMSIVKFLSDIQVEMSGVQVDIHI